MSMEDISTIKWYSTPPAHIDPGKQIEISKEYADYRQNKMDVDTTTIDIPVNTSSTPVDTDKLMRDLVKKLVK